MTNLDNAINQRLDGLFDVTFTGDHEQGVLEIPSWSTVCVCPTQNNVILTIQVAIFLLQCLQNLHMWFGVSIDYAVMSLLVQSSESCKVISFTDLHSCSLSVNDSVLIPCNLF